MSDLATRVEITKLAGELYVDEGELDFLRSTSAADVRVLRAAASGALFSRNEPRLQRIRKLSGMLPAPMTAKIAQLVFGPMLSARVAAVLPAAEAVKLAGVLKPDFLARLAVSLDPARAEPILRALPQALVVDVGRRLLAKGEHITLGRFVSVVSVDAAMGVVAGSTGSDLLKIALFTEEPAALEAIVRRLGDDALLSAIEAAHSEQAYDDAVALLSALSTHSTARLMGLMESLDAEAREEIVAAVVRHDEWREILPAFATLAPDVVRLLVNVSATLSVDVIDRVILVARATDGGGAGLVALVLAMDEDHRRILGSSRLLTPATTRDWLVESGGSARRQVLGVLAELGF